MIYVRRNLIGDNLRKEVVGLIDSSNFFGKGAFETILVNKKCVFLEEHLLRLREACSLLNIDFNITLDEVENFIIEENIENKALKITVTEKNVIFSIREVPYNEEDYEKGFSVGVSEVLRNSTSRLTYIKSTCYIENILEKNLFKERGISEPIFLNERSELTEGATTNIFFIKDNIIYTPRVSSGLLDGIIRKWIMKNFDVIEGSFSLEDLKTSDGAFLSNSLIGIMKITSIEHKVFKEHELIDRIRKEYEHSIKEF